MFWKLPFEMCSRSARVGVTGGCPAPYSIEAEARLSINLALLRGVQTPDTPPPPGNSLIPIMSVFPEGWLKGPLKPVHLLTLWSHSFRFRAQPGHTHPAPGKKSQPQAGLEE